eukprot:s48_g37.t1
MVYCACEKNMRLLRDLRNAEYVEALMHNLAALNGLNAGDLVRRLDRMDAMLEELLGQRTAAPCPPILTAINSEGAAPPTSPQESPGWQPLPPTSPVPAMQVGPLTSPLTSVKEEGSISRGLQKSSPVSPASPGDEAITSEDTRSHMYSGAKLIEVTLERDKQQPSWGLLWDRKSFTRKKRVLESLMPETPADLWNKDRKERDEDHLQKGDELVKLDGQEGWEACNELPNLHKVKLTFQRADQAKGRRQSKARMDGPLQASTRRQNLGSTSSNGRAGASLASPKTPVPVTPHSPADLAATWEHPLSGGRRNSDPDAIQVLKDSLEHIEGTGLEDRPSPATPPETTDGLQNEVSDPSTPELPREDRDIIVERIMEHSVFCAQ